MALNCTRMGDCPPCILFLLLKKAFEFLFSMLFCLLEDSSDLVRLDREHVVIQLLEELVRLVLGGPLVLLDAVTLLILSCFLRIRRTHLFQINNY